MAWLPNPYASVLFISALISIAVAIFAWRRRPLPGATPLLLLMLAAAEWSLTYAVATGFRDLPSRLFWAQVQYVGIVSVPLLMLVFVLEYTGRARWLSRRNLVLLGIVPLATLLLAWTNEAHGLIWSAMEVRFHEPVYVLELAYGPAFWLNAAYSYLLVIVAILLLLRTVLYSSFLHRRQSTVVLIGALLPWAGNILYLTGLNPLPRLDLTPIAAGLAGLLLLWGVVRYRLFDIVPLARETVIARMKVGVIVLDGQDRIVDMNRSAQDMVGQPITQAVGLPLEDALAGQSLYFDARADGNEVAGQVVLGKGDHRRYCDLHLSALRNRRGERTGSVILMHDVTRTERLTQRMAILAEVSQELSLTMDREDVLGRMAHLARSLLRASGIVVFTRQERRQTFRLRIALGRDTAVLTDISLRSGEGILGDCAQSGHPEIVQHPHLDARGLDVLAPLVQESETMMVAPLVATGSVIGVLGLWQPLANGPFAPPDLDFLVALARQTAIAMENARLFAAMEQALSRTQALYQASRSLMDFESLPRVLQAMADGAAEALSADRVLLYVVDLEERRIVQSAKGGTEPLPYVPVSFEALWTGLVGWVLREKKTAYSPKWMLPDPREGPEAQQNRFRFNAGSVIAAPMLYAAQVLGAMTAINALAQDDFEKDDLVLLESLANQAAAAVYNARLFAQMQEAKEAADRARVAAEAASQAKGTFLAHMSHELRTPLNAILGFARLMADDPNLSPKQRDNLATIGRSGEYLLALINNVLELSKIEAGRVELQVEEFDLAYLLFGLEEMFRLRAEERGLQLTLEQAPDLPHQVRGDQGKLRQVLINLLGNAIKFTEFGGVVLRVKAETEPPPAGAGPGLLASCYLRFEVEDTGIGIAPRDQAKIFEAFVQTDDGPQALEGTGLGLSISREFVRVMGGDLQVHSQGLPGQGSTFSFRIPVEPLEQPGLQAGWPAYQVAGPKPGQCAADGGPYRLLVVSDRRIRSEPLLDLLKRWGFAVRQAQSGLELLGIWDSWQPHLIWMEEQMQAQGSYEALRHIKASPRGSHLPVVHVCHPGLPLDPDRSRIQDLVDFVQKPVDEVEIAHLLARHLGLEFVFEAGDGGRTWEQAADDGLLVALAELPPSWLAELQQATLEGDVDWMRTLITQVRPQNAELADRLDDLAGSFDHDAILHAANQILGADQGECA